jgi:IS605 OrfB family transposase
MKKKRINDTEYINLKNKICKNNYKLWQPSIECELKNKKTDSWFGIDVFENSETKNETLKFKEVENKKEELYFKCIQVILKFNEEQKLIIHRWFNSYILMYNATLRIIKTRYAQNEKTILNYKQLRTYHMKSIRDEIIAKSQLPIQKNTKIKTHILDTAIQLACANYKSALTNLRRGHIRHFRIRYWKIIKDYNILGIEPSYFRQGSLCPKIFGDIECYYNDEKFDLKQIGSVYKSECKILYERKTNKYTLLVPEKVAVNNIVHKKEFISLDPGIRTFMTGLSENEIIKIGDNCQNKIKHLLKKIDRLEAYKIQNKKIRKHLFNTRFKLKNLITDMHWKSINFLTNNYKTILIGDLSVKGITNKKTSKLIKMTKRIGMALSFYTYRQRLKYKCNINNCIYSEVNEKFTSKMCSNCSYYKEDLGSDKIYNCSKCKTVLDRDINGCRGICLKMTE